MKRFRAASVVGIGFDAAQPIRPSYWRTALTL
jgi:hypothetical protein